MEETNAQPVRSESEAASTGSARAFAVHLGPFPLRAMRVTPRFLADVSEMSMPKSELLGLRDMTGAGLITNSSALADSMTFTRSDHSPRVPFAATSRSHLSTRANSLREFHSEIAPCGKIWEMRRLLPSGAWRYSIPSPLFLAMLMRNSLGRYNSISTFSSLNIRLVKFLTSPWVPFTSTMWSPSTTWRSGEAQRAFQSGMTPLSSTPMTLAVQPSKRSRSKPNGSPFVTSRKTVRSTASSFLSVCTADASFPPSSWNGPKHFVPGVDTQHLPPMARGTRGLRVTMGAGTLTP
mmetsp:Transcript_105597/g.297095  ORF Transcript_105597/g.297095 Transcript_105597/m.297095 type:complete len:293 (-) Transcript_105597:2-880(-)